MLNLVKQRRLDWEPGWGPDLEIILDSSGSLCHGLFEYLHHMAVIGCPGMLLDHQSAKYSLKFTDDNVLIIHSICVYSKFNDGCPTSYFIVILSDINTIITLKYGYTVIQSIYSGSIRNLT